MNNYILHRNNVRVTGRGKQPMIFAHGYGRDQNKWRMVAPSFEKDYQVILFDNELIYVNPIFLI